MILIEALGERASMILLHVVGRSEIVRVKKIKGAETGVPGKKAIGRSLVKASTVWQSSLLKRVPTSRSMWSCGSVMLKWLMSIVPLTIVRGVRSAYL